MLSDLLLQKSYINVNIKLIQHLGLSNAVYLSECLKYPNADSNSELINVNINRELITRDTLIIKRDQRAIEDSLIAQQLIIIDPTTVGTNETIIQINLKKLTELIADTNIDNNVRVIASSKPIKKSAEGKITVRQKACNELKSKVNAQNDELLEAYKAWIDGVYANPKGFLSDRSIKIFQRTIDEFAQGNLDLALKIIDIATVNGYRDATWAINLFNKDYAATFNRQVSEIKAPTQITKRKINVSTEVF